MDRNTAVSIGKGSAGFGSKAADFLSLPTAPADHQARPAGSPQEESEDSRDKRH